MNEQYIQNLYNGLGGESVFGKYDDFKLMMTTNEQYASGVYNQLGGEQVFGKYDDYSSLIGLKKKDTTALPSSGGQLPSQEAEQVVQQSITNQAEEEQGFQPMYGQFGLQGLTPTTLRGKETLDNFKKATEASSRNLASGAATAGSELLDLTSQTPLMGVPMMGQDFGTYTRKKIAQAKGEEVGMAGDSLRKFAQEQKEIASKIEYDPNTVTGFLGEIIPSTAGAAAAVLTSYVSAPIAGLVGGISTFGLTASSIGSGIQEYDDYKKETGGEIDPAARLGIGVLYGAAEFATEKLQMDRFLPKGVSKQMLDTFLGSMPKEILEKEGLDIVKRFAQESTSNSQLVNNLITGSLSEGGTELLTTVAQEASKYAYYNNDDQSKIFGEGFLGEAMKSFLGGAVMGAGLGPLSYGSQRVNNDRRRKQAGEVVVGRDSDTGDSVEIIGRDGDNYTVIKSSGEQAVIPVSRIEGSEVALSYNAFKNILNGSSAGTAMLSEDPDAPQVGESMSFGGAKSTVTKVDPSSKTVELKLPNGQLRNFSFDEYKEFKAGQFDIEVLNDGYNDFEFVSKDGTYQSIESIETMQDAVTFQASFTLQYPSIEFEVQDFRTSPTAAPDFRIIGRAKPGAQAQQPAAQEPGGAQPTTPQAPQAQPIDQGTTPEVPVEAPAPKIQDAAGKSVTVKIGNKNVSGIVEVDEGGKATITQGNKIYEIPEGTPFKEFVRPVSIAPNGDFVVNGEAFSEARIITEDGQKKALMIREDGTTKAITSPNLVEEIDYNITLASSQETGKTAIPKTELANGQGIEEARAIARQAKSRNIQQSIEKAAALLKVSYPDVDMIVGEDEADTKAKMIEVLTQRVGAKKAQELADGMDSNGQALFAGGKPIAVVINKSLANSRTAAHEVWHVVLRDAFGRDPKKFEQFRNEIANRLINSGYENIADALDTFAEGYDGDITYEEYLAEFGGLLSSSGFDPSKLTAKEKTLLQQIKEVINKFSMDLFGKEVFLADATPENIVEFMVAMSDVISRGEDVRSYIRAKGEGVVTDGKNVTVETTKQQTFDKGVDAVKKNAEEYKAKIGNKSRTNEGVPRLFGDVSKMMSKEYEKVKDLPNDPFVKASYDAMMDEVVDQYDFIVSKGLKVVKHTGKGEPYANSTDMLNDLKENNTLKFLPNEVAFGQGDTDVSENIGLQPSGRKLEDGYELTKSEAFRVVHDYFGHGILGNQFGPIGEENATLQHLDLFSDLAAPAVILQTRGQNSWVNFSGANDEAAKLRSDARKLTKEGKVNEANELLKKAEEIFKFADPKIGVFPPKFNFKRYETARRLNEQKAIDSRAEKADNELSGLLEKYSTESRRTRGVNRKDVQGTRKIGRFNLNTVAEYSFDSKINDGILKAFPRFKGVQKVYEVTDGDKYRQMMMDSLKDNPFASSVTIHSPEDFNGMRMFVTEDGSTGITITKEGFLGGAFSDPNAKRPNNLAQLMVLGIKEGGTTAEAFDTVLPDYYTLFGLKAVSRTAFNDEYRPLVENGNTIIDWDYDTYKKFNGGRPDVVFFIYDGGDRGTIEDRLGLFDTYNYYDKQNTKAFDKDGYMDAEAVMKQEAVKRLEFDAENLEVEVVKQTVDAFSGKLQQMGIEVGQVNEKTGKTKVTNFDIASALNKYYSEKYGTIAPDDFSNKSVDVLADYATSEMLFALSKFGKNSGKGWYTQDYAKALKTLSELDPQITRSPKIKAVATSVIALASNSTGVYDNLTRIIYAIDSYKKTGKVPVDVGVGKGSDAISKGVTRYNLLLSRFDNNPVKLADFMSQIDTISNLKKKIAKELDLKTYGEVIKAGFATNPEWNDTEVLPMSILIFGPKIGAFWSNLSGLDGTPTIDRWCIRTVYRYKGDMRAKVSDSEFQEFMIQNNIQGVSKTDALSLAEQHSKMFNAILTGKGEYKKLKKEKRNALLAPYRKGSIIWGKAKGVVNDIAEGIDDKIENKAKYARDFRGFTKKVFEKSRDMVLEKTGINLSVSDVQAILWIYEKNLFGHLGVKQKEDATYSSAAKSILSKVESGEMSLDMLKNGDKKVLSGDVIEDDGPMGDLYLSSPESFKDGLDERIDRSNEGIEVVKQQPKKPTPKNVLTENKGLKPKDAGKQGLEEILEAKKRESSKQLEAAVAKARAAGKLALDKQKAAMAEYIDTKKRVIESIQDMLKSQVVNGVKVSIPPITSGRVSKILDKVLKGKSYKARYKIDPGGNRVPYMSSADQAIREAYDIIQEAVRAQGLARAVSNRVVAKRNVKAGKLGVLPSGGSIDQLLQINPKIVPLAVFDEYMEIVGMIGKTSKALPLQEQSALSARIEAVMNQVAIENGLVEQLALAYDNHPKSTVTKKNKATGVIKTIESYSNTVRDMFKGGVISESDMKLMLSRKSDILPKVPSKGKQPATLTEVQNIITRLLSFPIPSSGMGYTAAQNAIVRAFNGLTEKDLMRLVKQKKGVTLEVNPTQTYSFTFEKGKIPVEFKGIDPKSRTELQVNKKNTVRLVFSGSQLIKRGVAIEEVSPSPTTVAAQEITDFDKKTVGYDVSELLLLEKVFDNLSNGYVTKLANEMKTKLNGRRSIDERIARVIDSYKNNPLNWVSFLKSEIKKKVYGDKLKTTTVKEKLRRTGNYAIDVALNNFENSDVYNELLRPVSVAIERKDKEYDNISAEVITALESMSFKDQFDQNTMVRLIMLHKMHLADPTMPTVQDWIDATMKGSKNRTSVYLEETMDKIQELANSVKIDDSFDLQSAMDKLSPKGKKLLSTIEKIQQDNLSSKVAFGSTVIRGSRVPILEYYAPTPRAVSGKKDVSAEDATIKNYVQPSSRASTFYEKTKTAHEISFDAVESILWSARHTLTDFYVTPELQVTKEAIKHLKSLGFEGTKGEAVDAVESVINDSIEMVLGSQFVEQSTVGKISSSLSKRAYQAMLSGIIRPGIELASNVAFAFIDGSADFMNGIKVLTGKTTPGLMSDAAFNLGTAQLGRMFNLTGGASRFSDSLKDVSYVPMRDEVTGMRAVSKVTQWAGNKFDTFSNTAMSSPDQIVARTVFFGALANKYEELTGNNIDLEKIADNDQEYMEANFENLKKSVEHADSRVAEGFSSSNPFDGILRNKITPSNNIIEVAYKSFNGFMNKFLVSEYVTSVKAVNAMIGNGAMSRADGFKLLLAQSARMITYSYLMELVGTTVYNWTSNFILDMAGIDAPEEEEEDEEEDFENKSAREILSLVATLAIDRNFGNFAKIGTTTSMELLNEKYGEGITYKGKYNQYEDNITFPFFDTEKQPGEMSTFNQTVIKGSGSLSPYVRNTVDLFNYSDYYRKAVKEETKEKHEKNLVLAGTKMLMLVSGVPLYREFNKIQQEVTFKLKEAEKQSKVKP
jgi:hypothetical protein